MSGIHPTLEDIEPRTQSGTACTVGLSFVLPNSHCFCQKLVSFTKVVTENQTSFAYMAIVEGLVLYAPAEIASARRGETIQCVCANESLEVDVYSSAKPSEKDDATNDSEFEYCETSLYEELDRLLA